ncbi:MAG TPA: hypothetical protein VK923_17750 [Euzebyales bacterium]|nr:hypothetical protein [Euzebyales bacterium]
MQIDVDHRPSYVLTKVRRVGRLGSTLVSGEGCVVLIDPGSATLQSRSEDGLLSWPASQLARGEDG